MRPGLTGFVFGALRQACVHVPGSHTANRQRLRAAFGSRGGGWRRSILTASIGAALGAVAQRRPGLADAVARHPLGMAEWDPVDVPDRLLQPGRIVVLAQELALSLCLRAAIKADDATTQEVSQ